MERQIKASLCRAASALPQPSFEKICATPIERMKEHDDITRQATVASHTFHEMISYISAVAAVFLICCYGYIFQYASAASFIEYSVNPSFSISVTRAQTLLEITPNNKDAEEFLVGRSYKGWNIEKALQSLTLSMADEGYLIAYHNTINIRVTGKDAQFLEQLLFDDINMLLHEQGIDAIINILPAKPVPNDHQPHTPPANPALPETDDDLDSNDGEDDEEDALEQAKEAAEEAADAREDALEQAGEAAREAADAREDALEQAGEAAEEAAEEEEDMGAGQT